MVDYRTRNPASNSMGRIVDKGLNSSAVWYLLVAAASFRRGLPVALRLAELGIWSERGRSRGLSPSARCSE